MTGLRRLARQVQEINDGLEERANGLAVRAANTLVGYLAFNTPVDTSQALSNWQIGINGPVQTDIQPHFPGDLGSTQRPSANETIRLARARLRTKLPGQDIYVSNPLPYIGLLDAGLSPQNRLFVAAGLVVARNVLRN